MLTGYGCELAARHYAFAGIEFLCTAMAAPSDIVVIQARLLQVALLMLLEKPEDAAQLWAQITLPDLPTLPRDTGTAQATRLTSAIHAHMRWQELFAPMQAMALLSTGASRAPLSAVPPPPATEGSIGAFVAASAVDRSKDEIDRSPKS